MWGSAGHGKRACLARRALAAAGAGAIATALSGPSYAQVRSQAGVIAAERTWVAALERGDAASLERLLAADFIDTDWQGALHDKAEVLRGLAQRPRRRIELSGLRVWLYGDIAIMRGRSLTRPTEGGQAARVRFTDVFVWRAGRWRAVSAQETLERT